MTRTIMAVTYTLTAAARRNDGNDLKRQFEEAAPLIAGSQGLVWKISAIDAEGGVGLGVYLFDTQAAAEAFADGPLVARLGRNPAIADLRITRAPVVFDLSVATGAAPALAAAPRNAGIAGPAAASR